MKTSQEWVSEFEPLHALRFISDPEKIRFLMDLETYTLKVQRDAIESAHKLAQQVVHNTFHPEEDDDTPRTAEDLALDIGEAKGDIERNDL